MGILKSVSVRAYTKEQAIANSGLNLEVKFDASTAWKNEEQPAAESTYFKAFAEDYLAKKLKGISGAGCIVTVEAGVADSRERPYKVENHVTDGARKYKTVYVGLINSDKHGNGGSIVLTADTKNAAEEAAKLYVTENKQSVRVKIMKEVTVGKSVAVEVNYAPSINTTLGTYIVFGYEREV
jgi:hypothetical protein